MLKALKEREKNELMGIGDQSEYMQNVSWPGTKLKKGYSIEKLFVYPEEGEDKWVWCAGIVQKAMTKKDDNTIVATIKWDKNSIGEGDADGTESEILKKNRWNPDKPKPGAWREDLRHLMKNTESTL